jgi:AcrR family transcriptional regulator
MHATTLGASGARARDVRHRRRGTGLEQAILDAAWEELAAVGYAAVSMEGVAERVGTSKAVLYRRWRNRAELVLAALRQHRPMLSGEVPDTGSLREDVLTLLRRVSAGIAEIGPATAFGLLDELSAEPEAIAYLHARQAGAETMGAILQAAAARGEVRMDRLTPRVEVVPLDLARHELLMTRVPVPDAVLVEIVDEVFLPLVRR